MARTIDWCRLYGNHDCLRVNYNQCTRMCPHDPEYNPTLAFQDWCDDLAQDIEFWAQEPDLDF